MQTPRHDFPKTAFLLLQLVCISSSTAAAQQDLTAAQNRLALALVSMRQSWYALEAETGKILEVY